MKINSKNKFNFENFFKYSQIFYEDKNSTYI